MIDLSSVLESKCYNICIFSTNNTIFNFTKVSNEDTNQEQFFTETNIFHLIENVINGYHATILAYGQTGSGKTYTIFGKEGQAQNFLINDTISGIIPKAAKLLFSLISEDKNNYTFKVSFIEIYNERVNDLLKKESENLKIRWTKESGYFTENTLIVECSSAQDILEVLIEGINNRKSGSHYLNSDSSRSHSILTINIFCKEKSRLSTLTFVDLAGSERSKDSKTEGIMLKETGNINKSLLILGKVITSLSEKNIAKHIPYRESKLTLLLSNCFGGNSKTLIIACINQLVTFADETYNTLQFAAKAMTIENKPYIGGKINEKDEYKEEIIKQNNYLRKENIFLRNEYLKLTGKELQVSNQNYNKESNIAAESRSINVNKTPKINYKEAAKRKQEEKLMKLKQETNGLKKWKIMSERQNSNLENENLILQFKLNNLETTFVGSNIVKNRDGSVFNNIKGDYNLSAVSNNTILIII
jgi:kinesin family protein 12